MLSGNVRTILGIVFFCVGSALEAIFILIGTTTGDTKNVVTGAAAGGLFFVIGLLMLWTGLRSARSTLRAFEHGKATVGKVTKVYVDTALKLNNRSPWAIEYTFEVEGEAGTFTGKAHTWDTSAAERKSGQPIHVLYMADDPDDNTIYPPVR